MLGKIIGGFRDEREHPTVAAVTPGLAALGNDDIGAGADGYMTKEEAADDLVRAITRIARGDRYVCASVAERLALGFASGHDGKDAHSRLSEREYKIFEMLVSGKRGWEIAQALSLSEKTVSTHKAHVLKKMNVSNRTELLLYAVKHNLVSV